MYEYVVFLWKIMNNEVVVWWTWNEFMNNCVDDVWKHVVDELVGWICHWGIDGESCCWCWIILKVWWNFELEKKLCLIHEFWAFWCMCLCTWSINFIWDEFWVWEDQNWSVGEKGFWNSKFFFWTDECSLKRTPSEPQANAAGSFLDAAHLSEPWANTNVGSVKGSLERAVSELQAKTLKRTSLRLSEPCPVQPHFSFRVLEKQS